jgi:hypothetical protein
MYIYWGTAMYRLWANIKILLASQARFIRRVLVASNAIKTIDNELHYLLFKLHSTRPKFDVYIKQASLDSIIVEGSISIYILSTS